MNEQMKNPERVKVWMRIGMVVEVDAEQFSDNPASAVRTAIESGEIKLDGDSYIPQPVIEEMKPELMAKLGIKSDRDDFNFDL